MLLHKRHPPGKGGKFLPTSADLNTERCHVYRAFVKLSGESSRTGVLLRLKCYQNPQAQSGAGKKASKKPDWKQVFTNPSWSALEKKHFLLSEQCSHSRGSLVLSSAQGILQLLCAPRTHRRAQQGPVHASTSRLLVLHLQGLRAGKHPAHRLPGTLLSPPPQLYPQAWPFPSAGTPAPIAD